MKTLKNYLKLVAVFFSALILFQGCTVYKSTTIQQAVQTESKVKVRTKNGETFKFSRIGTDSGNYYGVSNRKGETTKIALDEYSINTINEKDKTLSATVAHFKYKAYLEQGYCQTLMDKANKILALIED